MKKVSVLIPIYNTASYLEKCIESVRNQTYNNLEIILINDGSSDNSFDICERLQKIDKRIRIIDKPNTGQADSRYVGFLESTGEYIYCVDSDDTIEKNAIEILVNGLERTNSDMYFARFRLIDENGQVLNTTKKYNIALLNDKVSIIADALCANNIKASLCIKICRRELWEKSYTVEVRNTRFNEDYFLTVLFSIKSSVVGFSNHIIYNALQRSGSTCRSVKKDIIISHDNYFPIIFKMLMRVSQDTSLKKYWYWGYAKNVYLSLFLVAGRAANYRKYFEMYNLITPDCIFKTSEFKSCIRKKSCIYMMLDKIIRFPRLFYIITKIVHFKYKY